MDLQKAIKNRRTIHSFNTRKVPEIIIEKAIAAANYAPCHYHTFPWRFTSIKSPKRELLAQLALEIKFQNQFTNEVLKKKIREKALNPSHLIVASQVLDSDPKRKLEDYAACACAIQNLSLSLIEEGVFSKWSTGKIITHQKSYKIAEIDSKLEEIIGFIWIGYGEVPPEIQRPLISSVFRQL